LGSIKFGTDGWRGIIGEDFTLENVKFLSEALSNYIKNQSQKNPEDFKVTIGYDTRFLSNESALLISRILAENSIKVDLSSYPVPTPVVSYTTSKNNSDYGIIVTASHNAGIWNGIKIKDSKGKSISEIEANLIEKEIQNIKSNKKIDAYVNFEEAEEKGLITKIFPLNDYIKNITKLIDVEKIRSSKIKIISDCMHGTSSGILPKIFGTENLLIKEINNEGNPLFPGIKQPEPIESNLLDLSTAVKDEKADIGLAFDADSDRLGVIDENGNYIDTPYLFCMIADHVTAMKNKGPIVSTITMSSMVDKLASFQKVKSLRTKIGFKYVAPLMEESNSFIGGEESGGFAYSKHLIERDGIMSALLLLEALVDSSKNPSELLRSLNQKFGDHFYKRIDIPFEEDIVIKTKVNFWNTNGYINIGAPNQTNWERLTISINREDLMKNPIFKGSPERLKNRVLLEKELEKSFTKKTTQDWMEILEKAGVPTGSKLAKINQFIKEPNISSFSGNKITKLDRTDGLKINLENGDWIALRLSGTEPLIRFYCESSNQSQLDSMLNEILKKLDINIP
tara:strand:- start:421 stop:2121 length:1701 start_codon:yes stop_codon:yes gene_type:complete